METGRNSPIDGRPDRRKSKGSKMKRLKRWLADWNRLEKDYAKIGEQLKKRDK
jgi:hypothetical protein